MNGQRETRLHGPNLHRPAVADVSLWHRALCQKASFYTLLLRYPDLAEQQAAGWTRQHARQNLHFVSVCLSRRACFLFVLQVRWLRRIDHPSNRSQSAATSVHKSANRAPGLTQHLPALHSRDTCNRAHPRFPNAVCVGRPGYGGTFRSPFDSPGVIWKEPESPCGSRFLGGGWTKCTGEIGGNQQGRNLEQVRAAAPISNGAEGGIRTPTPYGATPSRWCVCQFRHFRTRGRK